MTHRDDRPEPDPQGHSRVEELRWLNAPMQAAARYARSLIEASLDPLVTISAAGIITDVNAATESVTGLGRDTLIGSDFADYFTEPEMARAGYRKVFEQGRVTDYPLSIRHTSGTITDVLYNASLYRSEQGEVLGVFAAARDITGRKHAEEAARTSSRYARSLLESSLDPLVTISPAGKVTDVNAATEKVTGLGRHQLIGSDFADYFTEPAVAQAGYRRVFEQGLVTDYPLAIRHTSGAITDVLYNASVYRDEKGEVLGVFAAARNITERKRAEDGLRAASHYARSLIEASVDPLVTISASGKITDVNAATERVTGLSRSQLVGSNFADYFTEPAKAQAGYQKVFEKGIVTDYPLAIRHASGGITEVLYNASVYRNERGEVLGAFAAARDITERKRAEALLEKEHRALERALREEVRTLRGIVPICASCKKIRDDRGFWNQVDVYVQDHTEAEFSHGICPECAERLYPGLGEDASESGRG